MIRVLVADDEELIRVALSALLAREPDMEIVGLADNGRSAVEEACRFRPDVAVVDMMMPGMDGLAVVRELGRIRPDTRVIILTGHGNPLTIRRALASGAQGFLAKGAPGTALADVVRRVHEGSRYVDPLLAAEALTAPPSPLTPREVDVLSAAGPNGLVKDAARVLFLSPGTVRNYMASIVSKLDAESRGDAYRVARENGWI